MKFKSVKRHLNNEEYNDFAELFELADINDEDIARDMNVDIQTVKSIKYEWEYEDAKDSPSLLFNRKRKPGVKSYYTRRI
ncbi:MAG: hypothetical protein GX759_00570 [Thermoanaerobacterales bacterium]|nr:hypothetical protein [Thermoanaerobacterales bacterium]